MSLWFSVISVCQRCVLSFGCSGDIFSERDIPVDSFGKLQYGGPEGSKVKIKKKKKEGRTKRKTTITHKQNSTNSVIAHRV